MNPIPGKVLTCSATLKPCRCCGRLCSAAVCEYCLRQLPLTQAYILDACGNSQGGKSLDQILCIMKRLGIPENMTRAAWIVLQINGWIEAKP